VRVGHAARRLAGQARREEEFPIRTLANALLSVKGRALQAARAGHHGTWSRMRPGAGLPSPGKQAKVAAVMLGSRARTGQGHPMLLLLLLLTVATLLLQGGSLPHSHQLSKPGLYNQEHDLTTLAAVGSIAPLPATTAVVAFVVALATLAGESTPRALGRPRRHADFRAPPTR
jgi:hypothetical protein